MKVNYQILLLKKNQLYEKEIEEHQIIENMITAEINIKDFDVNKDIQIINTFGNIKRYYNIKNEKNDWEFNNEDEINDGNIEIINKKK